MSNTSVGKGRIDVFKGGERWMEPAQGRKQEMRAAYGQAQAQ